MTVMKDYAKKTAPASDTVSFKDIIVDSVAIIVMGSILGLIIGYGLLYTGV